MLVQSQVLIQLRAELVLFLEDGVDDLLGNLIVQLSLSFAEVLRDILEEAHLLVLARTEDLLLEHRLDFVFNF